MSPDVTTSLPPPRSSSSDKGALIVHEGLPEKWHYTTAVDGSRSELSAELTVMFDGLLRCQLTMPRWGHNGEAAVRASRIRVLEWIGAYLHAHRNRGT